MLDVDSTLKLAESPYQYLHHRLGVAHLAAGRSRTGHAHRYGEWLHRDALLWAGQSVANMRRLLTETRICTPELLPALKTAGVTVALVDAGFTLDTDHHDGVRARVVLADELIVVDGVSIAARSATCRGRQAAFTRGLMDHLGVPPAPDAGRG